jgi:hypothetical protein
MESSGSVLVCRPLVIIPDFELSKELPTVLAASHASRVMPIHDFGGQVDPVISLLTTTVQNIS